MLVVFGCSLFDGWIVVDWQGGESLRKKSCKWGWRGSWIFSKLTVITVKVVELTFFNTDRISKGRVDICIMAVSVCNSEVDIMWILDRENYSYNEGVCYKKVEIMWILVFLGPSELFLLWRCLYSRDVRIIISYLPIFYQQICSHNSKCGPQIQDVFYAARLLDLK